MVKRIKEQRFEDWWAVKREAWCSGDSFIGWDSVFSRSPRAARIYRRVERRYNREGQHTHSPMHNADYLHQAYGRKRGHR